MQPIIEHVTTDYYFTERLRSDARAFFFVSNCRYFAKYVLNGKNSTFFRKNSGKNLRISKNSSTFALEKERQRRIASLNGADKTVKRAACNVGIAHRSDGAGDKTVKVAASKIYHTTSVLFLLTN